jgi:hypothetical protein
MARFRLLPREQGMGKIEAGDETGINGKRMAQQGLGIDRRRAEQRNRRRATALLRHAWRAQKILTQDRFGLGKRPSTTSSAAFPTCGFPAASRANAALHASVGFVPVGESHVGQCLPRLGEPGFESARPVQAD